jgi:hypothetical protein
MNNNFKPTRNRTALISNEILEVNRYHLKLNAQKLLFGLAQSIDHHIDMFPELEIDIRGIFKFLGIEERNDRYEIVRDALFNITENPLQRKVSRKKWSSIPWMSVDYDEEDSKYVKIKFDDRVKPYLLKLSEYTKIQGGYIAKLTSQYATWLYPIFKMIQTKYWGKHEFTIQRLKEYTFTDNPKKHPAYNTAKAATNNFLTRIVGIKKNRNTKEFEILENSPLQEINDKTDIVVSIIKVTKEGNKYKGVIFHVASKKQNKSLDKPKFENKEQYVSKIDKQNIPGAKRISLKEIYQYASNSGITVQDYCDKAGYFIKGSYAYKKLSEEEYNRYMKNKDKKSGGERTYRQTNIYETFERAKKNSKE